MGKFHWLNQKSSPEFNELSLTFKKGQKRAKNLLKIKAQRKPNICGTCFLRVNRQIQNLWVAYTTVFSLFFDYFSFSNANTWSTKASLGVTLIQLILRAHNFFFKILKNGSQFWNTDLVWRNKIVHEHGKKVTCFIYN